MLITGTPSAVRNSAAEDLHVAREHDEVVAPGEGVEHLALGLVLAPVATGTCT